MKNTSNFINIIALNVMWDMDKIELKPIGIIHSPYKESKDIPIQGCFKNDVKAYLELKNEYVKGLRDLEGFSHCFLVYFFHKSNIEKLEGRPYLEDKKHGIFAIRSPHRPNHIGISIVKIQQIQGNKLYFTQVDMIDGTPLLDIKPFVKYFDSRKNVKSGWIDKHFKDGKIPDKTIL
jgi:tRNA-Thr(GGU) m(6)t(6)A37 methyltransferase TsaA